MRRRLASLALLLGLWLAPEHGLEAAAPELPPLTGRVVDQAGLLGARDRTELDGALASLEQATTNQIVVVTVTSLGGLPIEDYGYQLGRQWGIGQAARNNGALLLVAPEERAVRIEVGYGLEGELTDATSEQIIRDQILPRFRAGDFPGGIKAGVAAMVTKLGGTYEPGLAPLPSADRRDSDSEPVPFLVIWLAWLAFILVIGMLNRRQGRRGGAVILGGGWGSGRSRGGGFGGGSGGGGFRGGGGSFGGGGASGRW